VKPSIYRAQFRALAGLAPLNDNTPPSTDTSPFALAAANGLVETYTLPGDTILVLDDNGVPTELGRMRGRQAAALEKILRQCLTPKGRPKKKRPGPFPLLAHDLAHDPGAAATIEAIIAKCRHAGLLEHVPVFGFRVSRDSLGSCIAVCPTPPQVEFLGDGSALLVCQPNASPGYLAAPPFVAAGQVSFGEFCAGGGGVSYGLRRAGGTLVYVNEINGPTARIHKLNHGFPVDTRSLMDVNAESLTGCDVLVACFPCQAFSPAGKQRGEADERGRLFLEGIDLLVRSRPLAIILENVATLAAQKHQDYFHRIIGRLETAGYRVSWRTLDAADYGVPQNRLRLIIVAYRQDMGRAFNFDALPTVGRKTTIEQAIGHLAGRAIVTAGGGIRSMNEYGADAFPKNFRDSTRVRGPHQQAYTVPAHAGGGQLHYAAVPEGMEGQPGILRDKGTGLLHRRLTLAEAAALQTFPAEFRIPEGTSFRLAHRVIGNAVPPLLAEIIGRQVFADVGTFRAASAHTNGRQSEIHGPQAAQPTKGDPHVPTLNSHLGPLAAIHARDLTGKQPPWIDDQVAVPI
jgi:DNA (cytosine-5)-methyltransferase 1